MFKSFHSYIVYERRILVNIGYEETNIYFESGILWYDNK